jgi:hypothetical protein
MEIQGKFHLTASSSSVKMESTTAASLKETSNNSISTTIQLWLNSQPTASVVKIPNTPFNATMHHHHQMLVMLSFNQSIQLNTNIS